MLTKKGFLSVILALIVSITIASTAGADSFYWNTASGDYGTSGNWLTGGLPSTLVPGAADVVYIGNAGVLGESTITSGDYSNAALYIDNAVSPGPTPGVLSISVGTLTTKAAQIGFGAGLGTVNVSGSNLGRLAITGSTSTDSLVIGQSAGAVGSINVSGGTLAITMGSAAVMNLGQEGIGVIHQTGGVVQGLGIYTRMIMGGANGGSGVYNLVAGTADFTQVTIGSSGMGGSGILGPGTGVLNISNGMFKHQVTGEFRMGQGGVGSIGTINQTGGSLHSLASLFMGYNAGSEATYNTSGTASSAFLNGLAVGRDGKGVVNIDSGATVTVGATGLYVGFRAGGSGTVNLRSRLNTKLGITYVGGAQAGTYTGLTGLLNIETGGLLDQGAQQTQIGYRGVGALTMSGGSIGSSSYIFVGPGFAGSSGSSLSISGGRINSLTVDYGNVGTAVGTISGTAEIFTTNRVTVGNTNKANVVMTGGSIRPLYLQIAVDNTLANGTTFDQSGGTVTVYGAGSISLGKQAEGTYTLSGTGAVTAPTLGLGAMLTGNGTLNIATGGNMTIANTSTIGSWGKGRVVVSGGVFNMGTSVTNVNHIGGSYDSGAGTYGSGSMKVTGGLVTAGSLRVGNYAPNEALLEISGGALTVTTSTVIGGAGKARLAVSLGGVASLGADAEFGANALGDGVLDITGGSVTAGNLWLGRKDGAKGEMTISSGTLNVTGSLILANAGVTTTGKLTVVGEWQPGVDNIVVGHEMLAGMSETPGVSTLAFQIKDGAIETINVLAPSAADPQENAKFSADTVFEVAFTGDAALRTGDTFILIKTPRHVWVTPTVLATGNDPLGKWEVTQDDPTQVIDTDIRVVVLADFVVGAPKATLTMAVSPVASGTTTPTGGTLVDQAVAQVISATPASGFSFVNWTAVPAGDAVFGDENAAGTTVTLYGDCTVTANFEGAAVVEGDFNGDGVFNALDIPDFKAALSNKTAWESATGRDADALGDFNGDGVFNALDIPGFKVGLAG